MIFIKNFAKKLSSNDVRLELTTENGESRLDLCIAEENPIGLVKSSVQGVSESMKKSIGYIGNLTNYIEEAENKVSVNILDNKASEVAFFVKGAKTVIKDTSSLPNIIDVYDEIAENNKHYPRDVIAIIVPNKTDDGKELSDFSLVVDRRNLGAKTVTIYLNDYSVILMYVKWPIWAKLKFPAYAYVKAVVANDTDEKEYEEIGAFKLGSITNKKIQRNQVIDVDIKEAKDYLDESFKILREKSKERNPRNNERENNRRRNNTHSNSRFANNSKHKVRTYK